MIRKRNVMGLLLFFVSALVSLPAVAYEVTDLPDLKKNAHAACPAVWESMYSRLIYLNGERLGEAAGPLYKAGDDIWHANPLDKSRYITFAYNELIPRNGELTMDYASADGSVILACTSARANVIETLIRARNDETGGYNLGLVSDDDDDGVFNITDGCPEYFHTCVVTLDQCPNTPSGEAVDASGSTIGCSLSQKDTDGDGVNDAIDQCDSTYAGDEVDQTGEFAGCALYQKDTDGDGLNDDVDQCLNTDEGLSVNGQGCARNQLDSDGDGINDDEDAYPFQHSQMCFP